MSPGTATHGDILVFLSNGFACFWPALQTVGGIYSSHMIMPPPLPISCNVGVTSGFRFFVELSGWPPTLQSMGEGAHNHEGRISSAYRMP